MREQILGLEVVLPDGRIWDGLRSLRKDSTGLDLKHLFIGSEGTLGIVTAAVFKLHPLPTTHRTALVALPSLDALMPLFGHARSQAGGLMSAFELLPEDGIRRVLSNAPQAQRPLDREYDWYVLLRLSGGDDVEDTLAEVLASAADSELVVDAAVASTADQEANLWFIRDEVPFGFDERESRHKFDIAIPIDRVVDFIDESGPLVDAVVPGTLTFCFGHVGDGNLHLRVHPGPDAALDDFDTHGRELELAIDGLTLAYGGTISAEHGVGQAMRHRLVEQKPEIEFDLMSAVKLALDPTGMMNPGKVIPSVAQRGG